MAGPVLPDDRMILAGPAEVRLRLRRVREKVPVWAWLQTLVLVSAPLKAR
jgi:hypothetical protein